MLKGEMEIKINRDGTLEVISAKMKATGGAAEIRKAVGELGALVGGELEEQHKPGTDHTHIGDHDHHKLHQH